LGEGLSAHLLFPLPESCPLHCCQSFSIITTTDTRRSSTCTSAGAVAARLRVGTVRRHTHQIHLGTSSCFNPRAQPLEPLSEPGQRRCFDRNLF
jgi:hypothetical protein